MLIYILLAVILFLFVFMIVFFITTWPGEVKRRKSISLNRLRPQLLSGWCRCGHRLWYFDDPKLGPSIVCENTVDGHLIYSGFAKHEGGSCFFTLYRESRVNEVARETGQDEIKFSSLPWIADHTFQKAA